MREKFKKMHAYKGKRAIPIEWKIAIVALAIMATTWILPRVLPAAMVSQYLIPVAKVFSVPFKLITGWIPFALLEIFFIAIIPVLIYMIYLVIKDPNAEVGGEGDIVAISLIVIGVMFSIFNITLGFGYHTVPLEDLLGYPETEVNAESIKDAIYAVEEIAVAERAKVQYGQYGVRDYGRLIREDYDELAEQYDVFDGMVTIPKRAILSVPMSYLGVGGMYSPFTCESIVSDDTTPPALPFTVAHEMAHSLCIAPEDEANFAAFIITMDSEVPEVKYSGAFMALQYLMSAYRRADSDGYPELYESIDEGIRADFVAYSEHVRSYDGWINDLQSFINDMFLKSNGQTAGVDSYGLMVDLVVAWNEAR